jgi:Leucine-rich repeat (LRR) protein
LTNVKTLRLIGNNITELPRSLLQMRSLVTLELEKNKLDHFFERDYKTKQPIDYESEVQLPYLSYLSLNGNLIKEIPSICKYISSLKQLHMCVNKVTCVREICRTEFENLETLDISNNQVSELPVAFVFYLKGLSQFLISNNNLTTVPPYIGFHKKMSTIQIDGNPLKQIRRQITEQGTSRILSYLRDRFIEGKDDQVEEWALE